jgi:hypothetical protein
MLTLEQATNVKLIAPPAEKQGWIYWWCLFRNFLPLLVMSSALMLEAVLFRLWLNGNIFSLQGVLRLLLAFALPFICLLFPLVAPILIALISALVPRSLSKPPPRILRLDEKGVKLSHTKYSRVPWKRVRRWFLGPFPGAEGYQALTLESSNGKVGRRYWSMLLDERDQKHALLSELEHLRQRGRLNVPVIELAQPLPKRRVPVCGLWAVALALYLIVHGLPLFLTGLFPPDSRHSGASDNDLSPAEQAHLHDAMGRLFRHLPISNEKELRLAFCLFGGTLLSAAAAFWFWGTHRQNLQLAQSIRLYDLEIAQLTRMPAAQV